MVENFQIFQNSFSVFLRSHIWFDLIKIAWSLWGSMEFQLNHFFELPCQGCSKDILQPGFNSPVSMCRKSYCYTSGVTVLVAASGQA